jgi:hypothetical protein
MQSYKKSKARNEARTVQKVEGMKEISGQDDPGLILLNRGAVGQIKSYFAMA